MMEDRRRRRIAFENFAKGMLRYLDNSEDVKVSLNCKNDWKYRKKLLFCSASGPAMANKCSFTGRRRIMYCQVGQVGS